MRTISYLILLKLRESKEMKGENSTSHISVQSLCRTCLSSRELQPLFPLKSKYRSFERALFLCTGLKIKPDDGLPQTICRRCSKFIESALQFRNQSSASQANLIQSCKYKKKTSLSMKRKDPFEIKNEQSEKIEVSLQKIKVDSIMDKAENIHSTNFEWSGNEQSEEFNLAPENLKENEEVTEKILSTKKLIDISYKNMMENSGDPERPIRCKECKKSMKTLLGFKEHAKRHKLGITKITYRILCEYCGMSHHSQGGLARHLQARHGMARDDRYPCSYCDFRALDLEMLKVHERRIHTKERPFVCRDCGEAFYSKRVLRQHMIKHVPDRAFQCHLCQQTFKSKHRVTCHIAKVHRERKYMYKCSSCPKTYASVGKTRNHIAKEHGIPNSQQGKLERINIQEEDT